MYCKNCGAEIQNSNFCPECGADQRIDKPGRKKKWKVLLIILIIVVSIYAIVNIARYAIVYIAGDIYYHHMVEKISDIEIPTLPTTQQEAGPGDPNQ